MAGLWRPRLSEEITEEQFHKLQELIPHGIRRLIVSGLVDSLIEVLESDSSDIFLVLLMKGKAAIKIVPKGEDIDETTEPDN